MKYTSTRNAEINIIIEKTLHQVEDLENMVTYLTEIKGKGKEENEKYVILLPSLSKIKETKIKECLCKSIRNNIEKHILMDY